MELVIVTTEWIKGWIKGPHAIPIEYESKETLRKTFIRLSKKHFGNIYAHMDNSDRPFKFCGHIFDSHEYYCKFSNGDERKTPPKVYTLEEWFDKFVIKSKHHLGVDNEQKSSTRIP